MRPLTLSNIARAVKAATVAGVLVGACVAPAASVADQSDGSPVGPSATSQITSALTAPLGALPPVGAQPLNIKSGTCYSLPGNICYVYFTMDQGYAATSFLFNNGKTRITDTHCPAPESFCHVVARGIPEQANIQALVFDITGPNIRNVSTPLVAAG
jgi:hypothetical protein